jgi:hypothetical protein
VAMGRQNQRLRTFESSKAIRIREQGEEVTDAELYRHNADDCRLRSLQARMPADKANWLKIAEEWQKLAEEIDAATATRDESNK